MREARSRGQLRDEGEEDGAGSRAHLLFLHEVCDEARHEAVHGCRGALRLEPGGSAPW